MIVAILPGTSQVESLLNSLSEADFDLHDVSVLMQDSALRNRLAKDAGPLKGIRPAKLVAALEKAGLAADAAGRCAAALASGKVLVAMKVEDKYKPAAEEMFKDHSAELIEA